jgi:hypothetical protein
MQGEGRSRQRLHRDRIANCSGPARPLWKRFLVFVLVVIVPMRASAEASMWICACDTDAASMRAQTTSHHARFQSDPQSIATDDAVSGDHHHSAQPEAHHDPSVPMEAPHADLHGADASGLCDFCHLLCSPAVPTREGSSSIETEHILFGYVDRLSVSTTSSPLERPPKR